MLVQNPEHSHINFSAVRAVWTLLALASLLVLVGCSPGGLSGNHPARDNDPKLTEFARSLAPVIHALDSHIQTTGMAPESLDQISKSIQIPKDVIYQPAKGHYRIGIKLGWDPILWYDSQTRVWTFDPGDGGPSKDIKLQP
jgi:hypothetical protein